MLRRWNSIWSLGVPGRGIRIPDPIGIRWGPTSSDRNPTTSDNFLSDTKNSDRILSEFYGIPVEEFRREVVGSRIPTISDNGILSEVTGSCWSRRNIRYESYSMKAVHYINTSNYSISNSDQSIIRFTPSDVTFLVIPPRSQHALNKQPGTAVLPKTNATTAIRISDYPTTRTNPPTSV